MQALFRPTIGKLTALCTLVVVSAVLVVRGQQMFSPGPLGARTRSAQSTGGVRSHAEIGGRCSACHAPPWSSETMASRCLDCHAGVAKEIRTKQSLHGRMPEPMQCRSCHTEHKGAHAELTSFAGFDHDWTAFPLTGKHREARCDSCHTTRAFRGTSRTCVSCHAEPASHKGQFGTNCASCHTTTSWDAATFRHSFPLNHGVGKNRTSSCATCHTKPNDYTSYTCYNCHKHEPRKTAKKHIERGIVEYENCASCHPTGRKKRR
jgi:hypothetical protein